MTRLSFFVSLKHYIGYFIFLPIFPMKKIISFFVIFSVLLSTAFAYTPTTKDVSTLNNVYSKIDVIYNKTPLVVEKLYKQILWVKDRYKSNERAYYLLSELENYIDNKITLNKTYKVIEIIDWDTIKVSYNWESKSIRFIGVDTPESYTTRFWYKECYWDEAKNYLKSLIENKDVKLEFDETQWTEDKYNRLLAYVLYNNENLNNKLIQEWYGWEYTYNKKYNYQDVFVASQNQAKESKKWLWAENTCNWERKAVENSVNSPISSWTTTTTSSAYYDPTDMSYLNMWFKCEKPKYCTQMTSCQEATYYWKQCWADWFDRDKDWIPCEDLCWTQIK